MKKEQTTVDIDFAEAAVPQYARRGIVTMFMIMLGFTFFSASMWVGQELADGLDFGGFLVSLIIGGLILSLYTGLLGYVGAETGMSLDLLARKAFGSKGSYLPSAMISFTQIGWFGVGIAMFAIPVANELLGGSTAAEWALVIIAGACMTASAYFGIKSLTLISYIAVPLVAILGTIAMVMAVSRGDGTIIDQFAKSSGTLTVSEPVPMPVPAAAFTATGADTGTLSGLESGGEYTVSKLNPVLTAVWEKDGDATLTHKVVYAAGAEGCTGELPRVFEMYQKNTFTASECTLTRKGYRFVCWVDESGREYNAGREYSVDGDTLTLTAKWEKVTQYYTVSIYATSGGSVSPSSTVSVAEGDGIELVATPFDGYIISSVTMNGTQLPVENRSGCKVSAPSITADSQIVVTFTEAGHSQKNRRRHSDRGDAHRRQKSLFCKTGQRVRPQKRHGQRRRLYGGKRRLCTGGIQRRSNCYCGICTYFGAERSKYGAK